MEDDFYATIKLISGEEIFCKVSACDENDRILLIISNPILITQLKNRSEMIGYKVEPWLKTTTEDMFILNLEKVLTMSESYDKDMIDLYHSYLRSAHKNSDEPLKPTRSMGYVSSVTDAKILLEKLYLL